MKIYLAKSQALDIEGAQRIFRAPGYFFVPEYLAEKWIGLGHAVEATADNTHVEPAEGWAWEGKDRHGPQPQELAPGEKLPKGGSPERKAAPKHIDAADKLPKGEQLAPKKRKKRQPHKDGS